MGFENRDYARDQPEYQDSYSRGNGGMTNPFGGGSIVAKRIIIVTIIVFLLQAFIRYQTSPQTTASKITEWLALSLPDLLNGHVWRLVTYAFCHDVNNLLHIVFNMLFVWWFGKTLETLYGGKEFLFFYLTAAVVAGLAFLGLEYTLSFTSIKPPSAVVGASGAVMAIMMVYACHFPRQKVLLMMVFPIEIRWLIAGYVIFDMFPVLSSLMGKGNSDGIAHSAHLGGLLFGYLYYRFHWRLSGLLGSWQTPSLGGLFGSRSQIKIYSPSTEASNEAEVDALLEKISREGIDSLSRKERKILEKASQEANRKMNQ